MGGSLELASSDGQSGVKGGNMVPISLTESLEQKRKL